MPKQKSFLILILGLISLSFTLAISFFSAHPVAAQQEMTTTVISRSNLPNIAIKDAMNRVWPGLVTDDRNLR
jgi:hypothetical protein